jgi:hypothetical protein
MANVAAVSASASPPGPPATSRPPHRGRSVEPAPGIPGPARRAAARRVGGTLRDDPSDRIEKDLP